MAIKVDVLNDNAVLNEGVCGHTNTPEKPAWITDMGNWNNLPKPIKPTTADEFYNLLHENSPTAEHRQIYDKENILGVEESYANVKIFWFSRCAILMVLPTKWTSRKDGGIVYTDQPKYFHVGCEHKFRGLGQKECAERNIYHAGRCYSVGECTECGIIVASDSSD